MDQFDRNLGALLRVLFRDLPSGHMVAALEKRRLRLEFTLRLRGERFHWAFWMSRITLEDARQPGGLAEHILTLWRRQADKRLAEEAEVSP